MRKLIPFVLTLACVLLWCGPSQAFFRARRNVVKVKVKAAPAVKVQVVQPVVAVQAVQVRQAVAVERVAVRRVVVQPVQAVAVGGYGYHNAFAQIAPVQAFYSLNTLAAPSYAYSSGYSGYSGYGSTFAAPAYGGCGAGPQPAPVGPTPGVDPDLQRRLERLERLTAPGPMPQPK